MVLVLEQIDRSMESNQRPWNKPTHLWNLIFDKEGKTIQWKKEITFNKWCLINWMSACRTMQIGPYLSPCTKLKSRLIKFINLKLYTLNLIKEKVGNSLELIGTRDNFLNRTPIALTLGSTIDKWYHIKLKSFCKAKTPSFSQSGSLQNEKRYIFLPTIHLIEG